MGCLTFIIFTLNLGLSLFVDAMCFTFSASMGMPAWIAIVGIIVSNITFILGYALSVEVTFAPRDFWRLSSFGVLMKKISSAWAAKSVPWGLWFLLPMVL